MPTRYGAYLKAAGFDVMSLANNHAGDFGDLGRETTRKTLESVGIKHAGSDKNDYAMTVLEVKGKKVAGSYRHLSTCTSNGCGRPGALRQSSLATLGAVMRST